MRLGAVFLTVLASLAAGSAHAESGRLSGMGANLFGNSFFHFGDVNLKGFPVTAVRAGRVRIDLQHTKLSEVQRAYGGTIQEAGQGMGIARWLCYQTDGAKGQPAKVWFMSNSLGGGEFIMMVAAEAASPMSTSDCNAAPAGFEVPEMGIPGIGSSVADLRAKFGSASIGSHSDVSYRADRPARDMLGTATDAEYIGYVVRGGVVVGFGVGETTTTNSTATPAAAATPAAGPAAGIAQRPGRPARTLKPTVVAKPSD